MFALVIEVVQSTAQGQARRESLHVIFQIKKILQEKAMEAAKQKEEKRKKLKPEEQEGMPQRQHRPLEKRRGDRNLECHKEQHKDVT
jgi:hypothetical protein